MTTTTEPLSTTDRTFTVHCGGCRTDTPTLGWTEDRVRWLLRAHMACCTRPYVARGTHQRWWLRALLAGETVPVPTRHGYDAQNRPAANRKPSFFKLLERLTYRGYSLVTEHDESTTPTRYSYRVEYTTDQRKG